MKIQVPWVFLPDLLTWIRIGLDIYKRWGAMIGSNILTEIDEHAQNGCSSHAAKLYIY